MKIIQQFKRIKRKSSSSSYINYLKKIGCQIGNDVSIYSPFSVTIDETRPWLIEIGNHVKITRGVTILTHGYDWSVLKSKYGEILGSSGKVKIGDNVFIGTNTTILKGVTIGDNVIIGANSLVNKDIPNNVVVAGNPAKIICTIEEYHEKRKQRQLQEATELVKEYYKVYGEMPDKAVLREFVWLFEDRTKNVDNNTIFKEIGSLCMNYKETKRNFYKTEGIFKNYEDFISYCKNEINK